MVAIHHNYKQELITMKKIILILALGICGSAVAEMKTECTGPRGGYAGFGYAADLRSAAIHPYRGHLYSGYRFCSGVQLEFRHTSSLGSDDGVDVTGDNENDIVSSENSLGAYYTVWF
jgi:hypothetical protein